MARNVIAVIRLSSFGLHRVYLAGTESDDAAVDTAAFDDDERLKTDDSVGREEMSRESAGTQTCLLCALIEMPARVIQ